MVRILDRLYLCVRRLAPHNRSYFDLPSNYAIVSIAHFISLRQHQDMFIGDGRVMRKISDRR